MPKNDIETIIETVTWAGRTIVGSAVLFVCATIMNDHERIGVIDTRLTIAEYKIGIKTTGKGFPISLFRPRLEAILPEAINIHEEEKQE